MDDLEQFLADITWFVPPGATATVADDPRPWTRGPVEQLPALSRLLTESTLTPIAMAGRAYELLAWGPSDDRRGWMCLPPTSVQADGLNVVHRRFLSACGGIIERFGEPDSWWSNQNEVLTEAIARRDLAPMLDGYSWLWQDDGLEMPIEPHEFTVVAVEANGNLTLTHRETGQLLLFAPDHSFEGVTPLPGCPEYSLMTLDQAPDLRSWIEATAAVWSAE